MKRRYFILASLVVFFAGSLFAQSRFTQYDEIEGLNKNLKPTYSPQFPAWGKMLYQNEIYFHLIDSLFNYDEERGYKLLENKAIRRYYILWRESVFPFVKQNGIIQLPTRMEMDARLNSLYRMKPANREAGVMAGNWNFVGPKVSFSFQGWLGVLKQNNQQVNIYCFDVAKSNSNIIYAGSETGFLNKTTNKGDSWQPCGMNYFVGYAINAVAIHPGNPDIVYVASGGRIHKTTDGGVTWNAYPGYSIGEVEHMKIDENNPSKIIAPSTTGLYISTDAGITWTKKLNGPFLDVEFRPDNSNIIYALTAETVNGTSRFEVYVSTDGGSSFSKDPTFDALAIANSDGGLLAVTPAEPSRLHLWLLGNNATPYFYTATYNSSGVSSNWLLKATGKTPQLTINNGQGYFDIILDVSPTDPNVILLGTSDLVKSTDGGTTFKQIAGYGGGAFPMHVDQQFIKFINGNEVVTASDGGIAVTTDVFTDVANTKLKYNNLIGSDYWGWDQGWNEDFMVGGRYHNGDAAVSPEIYNDTTYGIGGGESATGHLWPGKPRVAQFDDMGGVQFPTSINEPTYNVAKWPKFPNMDDYGYRRSNVFIHPNYYNTIFMGSGTQIWKSTDAATSFISLEDFGTNNNVRCFQISRSNPEIIYVDVKNKGLYRSSDGGETWISKPSLHTSYGNGDWRGNTFFVISPFNENTIYACHQSAIGKVFYSTDGGDTWTNWATPAMSTYNTRLLMIQPMNGNVDGVYLVTSESGGRPGGKIFFRSRNMNDWIDFSNNYPTNMRVGHGLPFFRDGKIRVAGNLGIWESPMYEPDFPPTAITPMVDKNKGFSCAKDTFHFDDYSILKHAGVSWNWSFSPAPLYVNNPNIRNPKVVFGTKGKYSVTLTVTVNGSSYAKTVTDMVDISDDLCGTIDTIPGKCLTFTKNEVATIPAFNISTNHFTMSFYVKPDAQQDDWAGLVLTNGNPKIGLNVLSNLELRYNWNDQYWWTSTGIRLTPNKWNHVAMVVEPDKTTIYLNGVGKVFNDPNDVQSFTSFFQVGKDGSTPGSRLFAGLVDELCFWNKALTQNEIREQMHLVKNHTAIDPDLIHYYQFNETAGPVSYDKVGLLHLNAGSAGFSTSTAPVGSGVSQRVTVTSAGAYVFDKAGMKLEFSSSVPGGELCATRLRIDPANPPSPDKNMLMGMYWIVDNYGNNNLNSLPKISFTDAGAITANHQADPGSIGIYQRGNFDDSYADWVKTGKAAVVTRVDDNRSNIEFANPSTTSLGQFALYKGQPVIIAQATLKLLSVELKANNVVLTWSVNENKDVKEFKIEVSKDGNNFTEVIRKPGTAVAGPASYNYTMPSPTGNSYYRITAVYKDNSTTVSNILDLGFQMRSQLFVLTPVPLPPSQPLRIVTSVTAVYSFTLYDGSGKKVFEGSYRNNSSVNLNKLPAGTYYYSIQWHGGMYRGALIMGQ